MRKRKSETSSLSINASPKIAPLPVPKTSEESFQHIGFTKTQIDDIKKQLNAMIDAFHENSSALTRAAKFWGELPLWHKIITGITVLGSLIAIAVATESGLLCAFVAVAAIASAFLLEDHYAVNKQSRDNLKAGISSLADMLDVVISELNNVCVQLSTEITLLTKENKKLATNVAGLEKLLLILDDLVGQFSDTEKSLQDTEKQLALLQIKFEKTDAELQQKVVEFNQVKISLAQEVDRLKGVSGTLNTALQGLSDSLLDEKYRAEFKELVENFVKNGNAANFGQIADQLRQTQLGLVTASNDFRQSIKLHTRLVDRQDHQVSRLEKLSIPDPKKPKIRPGNFGIFSTMRNLDSSSAYQEDVNPKYSVECFF